MDRRAFLQGMVVSVASGALIVKASDADIAEFGTEAGAEVLAQHGRLAGIPPPPMGQHWPPDARRGGKYLLYNHRGEAVAAVRDVQYVGSPRRYLDQQVEHGHVTIDAVGVGACAAWLRECEAIDERLKRDGKW